MSIDSTARIVFLFVLCLLFSACATVTKPLNESEQADAAYAYIYGRFRVETNRADDYVPYNIVLGIKRRGSTSAYDPYGIRFDTSGDVTAIKIEPGSYEFSKFNYVNQSNTIMQSSEFTEANLGINLTVEAGKSYYIGDWVGNVDVDYAYTTTYIEWKIDSVENSFLSSTSRFKEKYSNLSALDNVALFSPKYSDGFDRSQPATWGEDDLRLAVKYGEYDLAHMMIAHLKADSALARYFEGGLLYKGKGVEKNEKAGLDLIRTVALEDKQPDALFFMALEVRKFSEDYKDSLEEEKKRELDDLFIKYLISSAFNGSRGGIHMLCRGANPEADPITKFRILLLASCRAKYDIENASGETFADEAIDLERAKGRMDQQQIELYDSTYEKLMRNFDKPTGA